MMNGYGKSDSLIVPRKPPNKAQAAEEVEGRRLAKGNQLGQEAIGVRPQHSTEFSDVEYRSYYKVDMEIRETRGRGELLVRNSDFGIWSKSFLTICGMRERIRTR